MNATTLDVISQLIVARKIRTLSGQTGAPKDSFPRYSPLQKTVTDVGLTEKENEKIKTLSGGQKRKLSVGIALIGGSKVVFLGECCNVELSA